jgi:hypothetical protein
MIDIKKDNVHLCWPKKEYLFKPTEHQDSVYVIILLNPPYKIEKNRYEIDLKFLHLYLVYILYILETCILSIASFIEEYVHR